MRLIAAGQQDFPRLREFYIHVIDHTEGMKDHAKWVYGQHPSDESLLDYIDAGEMYYLEREGKIAGAIALAKRQGEEYHDVPWQIDAADDEVLVGHIMCVDPDLKGQGIAKELLKSICDLCGEMGKKAYRFDTFVFNTPAQGLYDSQGFKRIAVRNWYVDNIGWADFVLYEKVI